MDVEFQIEYLTIECMYLLGYIYIYTIIEYIDIYIYIHICTWNNTIYIYIVYPLHGILLDMYCISMYEL